MTTVESRPAINTGHVEGPLPANPASLIIDQFKASRGLFDAKAFSITTDKGTVTYSETKIDKNVRRTLHVTIGDQDASANADTEGRESVGWAHRDGKNITGSPTHTEDTLEAQTKMTEMLSRFLPNQTPTIK